MSVSLAGIPSLTFALAYLLFIPIFALAFWLLPNSFYHSTVQYEHSLNTDAEKVLKQLQKETIITFNKIHGALSATQNEWTVHIKSTHFHSLEPIEKATKFKMFVKYIGTGATNSGIETGMNMTVKFAAEPSYSTLDLQTGQMIHFRIPEIDNITALPTSAKLLFPYKQNWSQQKDVGPILIPITADLEKKIKAFSLTSRGFPTRSTGSYIRMLYFSAVTITTLGYGDIVPITTVARLLVAFESVLGIIFIGLFLNSLARENTPHGKFL